MIKLFKSLIIFFLCLSFFKVAYVKDTSMLEQDCENKGLEKGTKDFNSCVMKLYNKKLLQKENNLSDST